MTLNGINWNGWDICSEKLTKKAASAKSPFYDEVYKNTDNIEPETGDKKHAVNDSEEKENVERESKTSTQVLVKPDGSRVLFVKVMVAGMQSTMSLKLSEETDMPNSCNELAEGVSEDNSQMAELPN